MEYIESFIDISVQNENNLKKYISLLNDIMQSYEELFSLGGDNSSNFNCCENIAEIIAFLEEVCMSSKNLRQRAEFLRGNNDYRHCRRGFNVEVDDISSYISEVEISSSKIYRGKELFLRINSTKEYFKEDLRARQCLVETEHLLCEVEESYHTLSKLMHRTKETYQQMDAAMTDCCQPQTSIFKEMPTMTKVESKQHGLKSWIASHIGKKKKDDDEKNRTMISSPIVTPPSIDNYELHSCGYANHEKSSEIDIMPLEISEVQFSAVVQKKTAMSEYLPVNVIMYEDEFRNIVEEKLDNTVKETRSGYHSVEKNSIIKVVLSSKDIVVDDCEEERIWQGKYLDFGFVVEVPENVNKKQIMFCASVYVNDLIATRLKFLVDIKSDEEQNLEIERMDITTAFVSYASKDRNRVASIVQGMKKARPDMDVFFDVETLRSGQKWEEALKKEIDNRAVFFLCWSKSASESKWVDFEWRYALERKGDECIEPIPIEPPEICPPPIELQQKHFNDKMVYVIKALEYINRKRPCIIRKSDGEKVYIDKNNFTIGELKTHVDYVISSSYVSKIHAEVICENDIYYIIDRNSTNKTFVDNIECISGQKTRLENGVLIKIANEEFIFELL